MSDAKKKRRRRGTKVERDGLALLKALSADPDRSMSTDWLTSHLSGVVGGTISDQSLQRVRRAMAWLADHPEHSLRVERKNRSRWQYISPERAIRRQVQDFTKQENKAAAEGLVEEIGRIINDSVAFQNVWMTPNGGVEYDVRVGSKAAALLVEYLKKK
jgi:hypothetical protein